MPCRQVGSYLGLVSIPWQSGGVRRDQGITRSGNARARRCAIELAWLWLRHQNQKEKLTALLHHVSVDVLRWAFFNLKKQAAPGVDGLTWVDYAADLDLNLTDLCARVHSGAYRALPSRRVYIPKADGKQRPLGIAALEDKIVQAAVVAILTPVYEAEFLGFSYGFRPERNQHDALDALAYGVNARKINWVLDADIARFFDTLSREWLIRFIEHRVGDRRIIRLIQKWLKAGVGADVPAYRALPAVTARAAPMAGPTVPRQILKVGAECVNRARSDLCGGRGEILVPTAKMGPVTRPSRFVARSFSEPRPTNSLRRLEHCSLRHDSVLQIAPERHDQLARQSDKRDPTHAGFTYAGLRL